MAIEKRHTKISTYEHKGNAYSDQEGNVNFIKERIQREIREALR